MQICKRLLDHSEPLMLDVGETELLARTVIDCQAEFVRIAPVVSVVMDRLVRPDGTYGEGWNDLVVAVRSARPSPAIGEGEA